MFKAASSWTLSGIALLLFCLGAPPPVPASPSAVNPYDLITSGGVLTQTSPAAPTLSGPVSIPTEHVSGHVVADYGYNWYYAYDIGVSSGQVLIGLDIQLTGYNPGKALKSQWETGIETIWSNHYQVTDGTYDYPIVFDVHWVTSDPDQTVTVYNSYGNYNMVEWYTTTDWGNDYHDELAAHEAGHMFGLFDEYEGGATNPATHYTTTNALMADLGPVWKRYYNGFLSWMEDRSGLDLSLVKAPPQTIPYEFKFTYSNGDYYTGTVWAAADYGYIAGGNPRQVTDPYGNTGSYLITAAGQVGFQKAGQVYVGSYYDQESGKTFTPLGNDQPLGTGYLGTEAGYIIDNQVAQYYFAAGSQSVREADLVVGNKNTFAFHYLNGDYYTGAVYASPNTFQYYVGYREYTTDENSDPGYFEITHVEKASSRPFGQVFVYDYYDSESGQTFIPVNRDKVKGYQYLGSESGYIIRGGVSYLQFGGGYWEADPAARYNFTYYYRNGDYYKGRFYAPLGDYLVGERTYQDNETTPETGKQGYYRITAASYLGFTRKMGQVYVSRYYDGETAALYVPVSQGLSAVGLNYLGSESDWIIQEGVSQYYFGLGYYEADVQ
jgi:hypothetical protein